VIGAWRPTQPTDSYPGLSHLLQQKKIPTTQSFAELIWANRTSHFFRKNM